MMKGKTAKVLIAYVLGQVTQLVVHAVALNLWYGRQIPFCLAGGFIVLFALIAGVVLSETEGDKPEHQKTYADYAKIPATKAVDLNVKK